MRPNAGKAEKRDMLSVTVSVAIVAAGIFIAVAAAPWLAGLVGIITGFEKLEIRGPHVRYEETTRTWTLTIVLENVGTNEANVSSIYLNDIPCSLTGSWTPNCRITPGPNVKINIGGSITYNILVREGEVIGTSMTTSGTILVVRFHTEGGKDYVASTQIIRTYGGIERLDVIENSLRELSIRLARMEERIDAVVEELGTIRNFVIAALVAIMAAIVGEVAKRRLGSSTAKTT